jgi:hypothetical protein
MIKQKFKEYGTYALMNPFDAAVGASLYVVAVCASMSMFMCACMFGYALIKMVIPH